MFHLVGGGRSMFNGALIRSLFLRLRSSIFRGTWYILECDGISSVKEHFQCLSAQNHSSQHNYLRIQWFVYSLYNVFSFSTESVNSNCHLEHACIAANVNKTLKRVSRHFRLKYILRWHFDLSENYRSPIWKQQQLNPM